MCFEQILVPYDASSYANHAFQKALEIAEKFGSKITVLTVLGTKIEDTKEFHLREQLKSKMNKRMLLQKF